jgi:phosphoenolpyruvate carboxykinase (GTP)
VNYFLKDENGNWLNEREDKRVWLKWMELRVHNEAPAIETPTGYIPRYEDLKRLFNEVLKKDYTEESYVEQFIQRLPENLQKIDRIVKIYKNEVPDSPGIVFDILDVQHSRLLKTQKEHGDYVSPFDL